MVNFLREIRKEKKLTLEQVAERADASTAQIQKLERGERRLTIDWVRRLAVALDVTEAEILGIEVAGDSNPVPVVGYVGAGAEVFPIDDHHKGAGLYEADAPPHLPHGKGIALEVRGDSMMPFIQDGFILFYNERYPGVPPELVNKMCVVQVQGGPCLVKWIRKGDGIGRFTLESINPKDEPIRNVMIEWSAFVDSIKQR